MLSGKALLPQTKGFDKPPLLANVCSYHESGRTGQVFNLSLTGPNRRGGVNPHTREAQLALAVGEPAAVANHYLHTSGRVRGVQIESYAFCG